MFHKQWNLIMIWLSGGYLSCLLCLDCGCHQTRKRQSAWDSRLMTKDGEKHFPLLTTSPLRCSLWVCQPQTPTLFRFVFLSVFSDQSSRILSLLLHKRSFSSVFTLMSLFVTCLIVFPLPWQCIYWKFLDTFKIYIKWNAGSTEL